MAQQALSVEQLLSQARNPTHGQTDKGIVPQRVFNLVPDRMGGYVPFGRRSPLRIDPNDPDSEQLTLDATDALIGMDESGISSFRSVSDELRLYRGRSLHTSSRTYARASEAVHLDGAGAYLGRDEYLVLSRELNGQRLPVEPLVGATAGAQPGTGSPLSHGHESGLLGANEVAFGDGDFMLITSWKIWRFRNGAWSEVYHDEDEEPTRFFTRIAFANGVWIASRSAGLSEAEVFLRSTNAGGSWSEVATPMAGIRTTAIAGSPGGVWVAAGYNRSSNRVTTMRSMDGGVTWDRLNTRSDVRGYIIDMVCRLDGSNPNFHLFTNEVATYADSWVYNPADSYFDVYWGWAINYWPKINPGNGYKVHGRGVTAAPIGSSGPVLVMNERGVMDFMGAVNGSSGMSIGRVAGRLTESGGTVSIMDMAAAPGDGPEGEATGFILSATAVAHATKVIVGSYLEDGTMHSQPRVWRAGPDTYGYQRWGDAEQALSSSPTVLHVAVDGDGNFMMIGESGHWVFSGSRQGLTGGDYNIYTVSYFNTHAGKFVYDMQTTTITTEDGGFIDFSAPNKAYILQQNPWLAGREAILDDLRFDVYVQRVTEPILGEDVANTIRYAFTDSFPGATSDAPLPAAPINRTINELPLGRQFLTHGEPTTAVFEKRHTALHNGRVWGLAAQDEDLWPNDVASPEIANQNQRFVLSYTEIGWANLISDQSWIVIQPTQSTRFTGMLSTPSGLLVMFENEIHLVTGDPAFGNVSVELYLDMVGHDPPKRVDGGGNPLNPPDPGPQPCKVGGVPFVIWNGKVWVLQAGQAQQIGAEQWLRDDGFKRISPEPQTRSLLALTESGSVFRYILDDQFWLTDPATVDDEPVLEFLTNCACESGDNTRFMVASWEPGRNALWSTRSDFDVAPPDTPHVLYRDLDFGALDSRSALYLVKVGLEGDILTAEYDRSSGLFDPMGVPTLHYLAANEGDSDLVRVAPMSEVGVLPTVRANNRRSNTIAWRLPLARTRGSSIDVRLEFRGFEGDDVVKMPLQFFFARGGVVR